MEGAKKITLEYEGTTYTLEFNRSVVGMMERQGFNIEDIDIKPVTTVPALFAGAFRMHHMGVSRKKIDEIYEKMPRRAELVPKLAEMYAESVSTLFDEPEEKEGNLSWDPSW